MALTGFRRWSRSSMTTTACRQRAPRGGCGLRLRAGGGDCAQSGRAGGRRPRRLAAPRRLSRLDAHGRSRQRCLFRRRGRERRPAQEFAHRPAGRDRLEAGSAARRVARRGQAQAGGKLAQRAVARQHPRQPRDCGRALRRTRRLQRRAQDADRGRRARPRDPTGLRESVRAARRDRAAAGRGGRGPAARAQVEALLAEVKACASS